MSGIPEFCPRPTSRQPPRLVARSQLVVRGYLVDKLPSLFLRNRRVDPGVTLFSGRSRDRRVRKNAQRLTRGCEAVSLGCHVDGVCCPTPSTRSFANHVEAFVRRLARPMPGFVTARMVARSTRHFIRSNLSESFGILNLPGRLLSYDEWKDSTNYSGSRKTELDSTRCFMAQRRPNPRSRIEQELGRRGMPRLRVGHRRGDGVRASGRDERVNSHLKGEWYEQLGKAPREICARIDPCKIIFGPLIKSMERIVYELVQPGGSPYFIKHVPVDERPATLLKLQEWGSTKIGTVYRGTDYSTFERISTPRMMYAAEVPLYLWLAGLTDPDINNYPDLKVLTDAQLLTLMFIDMITGVNTIDCGWFQTTIVGCRMSGEMNTSLGNGWVNLMLFNCLCEHNHCEWRGHVEGDDGIFAISPKVGFSVPSAAQYTRFGAEIKLEDVRDVHLASFCGNIFDPVEKRNVADPRYVVATVGWSLSPVCGGLSENTKIALLRAKAMSVLAEYHGTPIVTSLARYILRTTPAVAPRWSLGSSRMEYWSLQTVGPYLDQLTNKIKEWVLEPVGPGSRRVVESVYGISVVDQLRIERYFDSLKTLQPLNPPMKFPDAWRRAWEIQVGLSNEVVLC